MGKLSVYNFVSLNGYFKGPGGDISWAHQTPSEEENQFASENAQGGAILLFGRVTYEMMAAFWPSHQGKKANPGVAKGMTSAEKIVVSRTMKKADWDNTRIISHDLENEIKKLKGGPKSLTILGSGSLVSQLASMRLIDEFQIMIHPVAIGTGTSFLNGININFELELISTRSFKSGSVLLSYKPKML